MGVLLFIVLALVVLGIVSASLSARVVNQVERGVVFRLGRVLPETRRRG